MKTSLIISIYNNVKFLQLVLESIKYQTDKNFEIIISEDGQSEEVKNFISSYTFDQNIIHCTQVDKGWQKNKALNNAIKASNGDWLIFIDGDCLLHPRFVEYHKKMANDNVILAGKRLKLSAKLSYKIMDNPQLIKRISWLVASNFWKAGRYFEEAIFIHPKSICGWITKTRSIKQLKGCNMSFSKEAIYAINGFDEDYILPAIGEDIDLVWRFKRAGYQIQSVRNIAVMYHLHHKENWHSQEENKQKMAAKKEQDAYICKNGLIKL